MLQGRARRQGSGRAGGQGMGSAEADGDEQSLVSAAAVYGLLATLLRRAPRDISLTSLATLATLDRAAGQEDHRVGRHRRDHPAVHDDAHRGPGEGRPRRAQRRPERQAGLHGLPHQPPAAITSGTAVKLGTETFATLVSELPPEEAAALAAAVPALVRLREIDNQQRDALLRAR